TVQIMIGLMMLLIGIMMITAPQIDSIGGISERVTGNECRRHRNCSYWRHSLDGALIMLNYNCDYPYYCLPTWRSHGISGVMAVFSALEFIVSICVSSFACNAVCCHSTPE
ncbi:unnamed protein product, partial [Coregonus sp. 'balchen']